MVVAQNVTEISDGKTKNNVHLQMIAGRMKFYVKMDCVRNAKCIPEKSMSMNVNQVYVTQMKDYW